jgi:hypothetical protein
VPGAGAGGNDGGDIPRPPLPPIDELPPPDDDPEKPMDDGERADRQFEAHKITPPTPAELQKLQEKENSVDWLGFITTRSPIATTFGDEDGMASFERHSSIKPSAPTQRLAPQRADEIVDRQLSDYSTTLTRVQEGIEATADLTELTAEHSGRTLITKYPQSRSTFSTMDGYSVQPSRDGSGLIVTEPPVSQRQPDHHVRHDTPDGEEVHLITPDATRRSSMRNDNDELVTTHEVAYSVDPSDTEYFSTLNQNLAAYQGLLLDVADHAGFSRESIVDASGQVNMAYLLETADPVISRPEFQASLPADLRTNLEVHNQAIANRVNSTYIKDSLVQRGFRLGGYFRAALGRRDF